MPEWQLTLTHTDDDGKTYSADRIWHGDGVEGMGGILGKHDGRAESLKGVRYALVLVVLAMIDSVERQRHQWTR